MMKSTPVCLPTLLAVLAATLTGCLAARMPTVTPVPAARPMPRLINHPKPNLNINQAIYEKLDCDPSSGCRAEGAELASLGCEFIQPADSMLGGLSPSYPIAQCSWRLETGSEGLYSDYCGPGYSSGLAVLQDGRYQLVKSASDLRDLYAPIESEDEALSFAILATGLRPAWYESLSPEGKNDYPGLVFLTEQLEDTHVTKGEDGYTVRLYHTEGCGCSSHPTSAADILVTVDGHISTYPSEASPQTDELRSGG
jgi:hypothetical protein